MDVGPYGVVCNRFAATHPKNKTAARYTQKQNAPQLGNWGPIAGNEVLVEKISDRMPLKQCSEKFLRVWELFSKSSHKNKKFLAQNLTL